jgi:Putative restriction endonuclease
MLMSTAADWLDVEDDADPDTLKVPENPDHRRMVDAIGIVAARQLRPNTVVYRDMNWYPSDGGHAMAPDLMTLPVGVLERGAKSYQQRLAHLPSPGVVIEVPSNTDTFDGLRAKAARCNALGVDVYVISTDPTVGAALRFAPGDGEFIIWTGKPIVPLGGLSIEVVGSDVMVRTAEGLLIAADIDLLTLVETERDEELQTAFLDAEKAHARAAELEAQLRALGAEPR